MPVEQVAGRGAHGSVTEVIRPAAIVPEEEGREILYELSQHSITAGGVWHAEPSRWNLYDRPWAGPGNPGGSELLGTIQVAYGTPSRYEITIFRVTITTEGQRAGCTVESLSDLALGFAGMTLADCPRLAMAAPPRPYRH